MVLCKANQATKSRQAMSSDSPASSHQSSANASLPGDSELDASGQPARIVDHVGDEISSILNNMSIANPSVADAQNSSASMFDQEAIQLPGELWLKVIQHLDPKSLKNARQVNKAWKDFSTPNLFRTAIFSPEPLNIKNLRKLASAEHLANYVEKLYLDCTSSYPHTTDQYARTAADYFAKVFALGEQKSGPLCAKNLLEVLQTDSTRHMSHKYLTGKPRGHFIAGYTLYQARANYTIKMFRADEVYPQILFITSKFKNLRHMETLSYWSTTEEPYQKDFQRYLMSSLPKKSIDLISGFEYEQPQSQQRIKTTTTAFDCPGAAARDLHPMIVPPSYSTCSHVVHWHEIVNPALRALRENKIELESLSLPGNDQLSIWTTPVHLRSGVVPMTTLLEGVKTQPHNTKTSSVLLPLFRHLKVLELCIDFAHPGNEMRRLRDRVPSDRIRKAIQQMSQLESLSLGAPKHLLGDYSVWNLSSLMLYKEEDYPKLDEDDEDDNLGQPPAGAGQMLNALFGPMLGIAMPGNNAPPASGPTQPTTSTTAAGTSNSTSQQASIPSQTSSGLPPHVHANTAVQFGATSVDANGNTTHHAMPPIPISQLFQSQTPSDFVSEAPGTPIDPIPWPKLKYLSLWNLPATPQELSRLVKTVKKSLKILRLDNVHFDEHRYAGATSAGQAAAASNLFMDAMNDNEMDDEEEDDDDQDIPDLLNWSNVSTDQASADSTQTSHDGSNQSGVKVKKTSSGSSAPTTNPQSTNASNATTYGLSPLFGLPQFGASTTQPPPANATSTADAPVEKDLGEEWMESIEVLADELRLDDCEIILHPSEENKLRQRLAKEIKESWKIGSLNAQISEYLKEGDGMGFPLHITNTIERIKEESREQAEKDVAMEDAEDEDGDSDDEDWDDEDDINDSDVERMINDSDVERMINDIITLKRGLSANKHFCSSWQACPRAP